MFKKSGTVAKKTPNVFILFKIQRIFSLTTRFRSWLDMSECGSPRFNSLRKGYDLPKSSKQQNSLKMVWIILFTFQSSGWVDIRSVTLACSASKSDTVAGEGQQFRFSIGSCSMFSWLSTKRTVTRPQWTTWLPIAFKLRKFRGQVLRKSWILNDRRLGNWTKDSQHDFSW